MFGSGIQRINAEYAKKFVKPQYKIYDHSISIVLPVVMENVMLSEDEEEVFHLLKGNMKLSQVHIEEACHFNKYKTIWILHELIKKYC